MRIKEVQRTSNLSWSPANLHPLYIAAGTSAKQLDASFSSSSRLEVLEVDTASKEWDMPVRGSLEVSSRFNVIEWGSADREMGLIAGGGDNGIISLWDPAKILSGDENAVECEFPKHCGPVRSMDFNPSKKCLLASGASSSEIHIVDINAPSILMTPGPKAQPEDDVVALAWNKQVEHILVSAHPNSARSIVWDLRKNEAIIQVTDASNRLRCSSLAWHPDIATQLLTCSDEDRYPVIQMWDLRFATTPTMVLEGHQRGIQTLAWCSCDSGLLISCSRDDHMICWNPNNTAVPGGDRVVEFSSPSQWTFDMGWCPRNPYLVASSSFSGKLSVFSLFGGNEEIPEQPRQRMSSDPFAPGPPAPSLPMAIPPLNKAPKWLMRPCGLSFGFGGKLTSFNSTSNEVTIMQVTTERQLVERSEELELALQENTLLHFCNDKAQTSEHVEDKQIWSFLKSTFDGKPRQRYLELLGYNTGDLKDMVTSLTENVGELGLDSDTALINKSDAESSTSAGSDKDSVKDISEIEDDRKARTDPPKPLLIDTSTGVDGLISRAMLLGRFEVVVDLCLKAGRMADALAVAMAGGRELFQKTQQEYFKQATSPSAALLSFIISQRWSNLVETVELSNWKEALAILLSYAKPSEFNGLCDSLAGRLSSDGRYSLEATLCYICSGNVSELLTCWQHSDPDSDPIQLQELIEKVMCLQSTAATTRPLAGDKVVANLLRYSRLLADQGKLTNALTYINITPPDVAVQFKYQLHRAINDPSLPRPVAPYTRTRLPSLPQPPPSPAATPSTAGYTDSASIVSGNSVYSHSSKVSYHAPSFTPAAPTPYQPAAVAPPVPYQPAPPAPYQPAAPTPYQPATPSPYQPAAPVPYQPAPPVTSTGSGLAGYQPPVSTNYNAPSFTSTQPGYAPYTPAVPDTPPQPKAAPRAKGAWNDPPMLKKKTATNPPITSHKITTPVVGPIKTVDIDPTSPANYGSQAAANYGGQQHPGYEQYNYEAPQPPTPPAPVEKPQVPEQYSPMLDALESAVVSCKTGTQNPTHRRKLEEVGVKLEALKDKLRYDSVSGAVVSELNGIAGALNNRDYNQALAYHARLAQTANFSEVGSFLPGIKVLLQIGAQLHAVHHY